MTYKPETPDRPEGWRYSKLENKKISYSDLWKQFSQDFRNQETRDITGRSNSYNPPMEQIDFNNQKDNL